MCWGDAGGRSVGGTQRPATDEDVTIARATMTKYCVPSPRLAMSHAFARPWCASAGTRAPSADAVGRVEGSGVRGTHTDLAPNLQGTRNRPALLASSGHHLGPPV